MVKYRRKDSIPLHERAVFRDDKLIINIFYSLFSEIEKRFPTLNSYQQRKRCWAEFKKQYYFDEEKQKWILKE
jgi:hypothetical protein